MRRQNMFREPDEDNTQRMGPGMAGSENFRKAMAQQDETPRGMEIRPQVGNRPPDGLLSCLNCPHFRVCETRKAVKAVMDSLFPPVNADGEKIDNAITHNRKTNDNPPIFEWHQIAALCEEYPWHQRLELGLIDLPKGKQEEQQAPQGQA